MKSTTCFAFKGFSEQQTQSLAAIAREAASLKGRVLFQEGRPARLLYCLKKGEIELLTKVDETLELPITLLRSEGQFFGTSALIEPHVYSLSARCKTDCVFYTINQEDLTSLGRSDPDLGFIIMTHLAKTYLDRLTETRRELKTHFKTIFKAMRF